MSGGEAEPLTEVKTAVGNFAFSPDGKWIAFAHARTPKANDWTTSDVSAVEVSTGKITALAQTPAAESSPRFSPDGKWIALLISDNPPRWAQSGQIKVIPAAGGTPKALAASHDGQPNIGGWSGDGRHIFFSEARGTGTQLYALDVASNKITSFTTPCGRRTCRRA